MRSQLLRHGFDVAMVQSNKCPLEVYRKTNPDLVIIETSSPDKDKGLDITTKLRRKSRYLPLILVTRHSSEDLAIAALRAGGSDYVKIPFSESEFISSISRHLSPQPTHFPDAGLPKVLIGRSTQMQAIRTDVPKIAAADTTALITGETGTGKELVAEMVHTSGPRKKRPFIGINCAAIPENLVESELFGYQRGAFTGAMVAKQGKFQIANGGTVFLDEIGEMNIHAQAKILNAIERREVSPLGGSKSVPVDIRVIAATNRNPEELVKQGTFRDDLYYRLNVVRLHLPALQERKEDIVPLLNHFIGIMNKKFGRKVEGFTEDALALFLRYAWPGNIRELRNLVEATFVNLPPRQIAFTNLPQHLQKKLEATAHLPQSEKEKVISALFATNWNKSKAAEKLCWSRMTLYRKMAKHNIIK